MQGLKEPFFLSSEVIKHSFIGSLKIYTILSGIDRTRMKVRELGNKLIESLVQTPNAKKIDIQVLTETIRQREKSCAVIVDKMIDELVLSVCKKVT